MKLIINADDFGLTKDTNSAILDLIRLGTISSTTVMVNMPFAFEIKQLLPSNSTGIGLHFNLTQGKPVADKKKIESLVDDNGNFYSINKLKERIKRNLVNRNHVLIELELQYNWLLNRVGNRLTHIDSHQDINKIGLITSVLKEFSNKIETKTGLRWYNKSYLIQPNKSLKLVEPSFRTLLYFGVNRVLAESYFRIKKNGLRSYFYMTDAMLYAKSNNMRDLLRALSSVNLTQLPDVCLEIMCHPAKSIEGLSDTRMLKSRVEEYEILKSDEFIDFAKRAELVSYSYLWNKKQK